MEKKLSTRMVGGLLIGLVACGLSACAVAPQSEKVRLAKTEAKLRRAKLQIESLKEVNTVLRRRIKIAQAAGSINGDGADPQLVEPLAAFKSGVQLDVPISSTRENVALVKKSAKRVDTVVHAVSAERADRVLANTVIDLLKTGDSLEAERTATLLEKSYPESELIAEARFQQGLYFFRKKDLQQADRFFQSTLMAPKAHTRAKAGAVLMRGIIARRLAEEGLAKGRSSKAVQTNFTLSRKSFEYVRKVFPNSPEAKRAGRELRAMVATPGDVARVK